MWNRFVCPLSVVGPRTVSFIVEETAPNTGKVNTLPSPRRFLRMVMSFELTRSAGEFQRAGLSQGQKPFLLPRDWTPVSGVSRVRTVGILGLAVFALADPTSATVRGDVWSSVTQESLTNASTERSLSFFEPQ